MWTTRSIGTFASVSSIAPEDGLGVLDIDISTEREAEEGERLLPVDQRDDSSPPGPFQPVDGGDPPREQHPLLEQRLDDRGDEEEEPDDADDVRVLSLARSSQVSEGNTSPSRTGADASTLSA